MIFVTVGTQLPFDRLVNLVDDWSSKNAQVEVIAQIGPSKRAYRHLSAARMFFAPNEYSALFSKADIVISHAGMGTILNALRIDKPLIVMARRHELGEHRNDHQRATVRALNRYSSIAVVEDGTELERALSQPPTSASCVLPPFASHELTARIRSFLTDGRH